MIAHDVAEAAHLLGREPVEQRLPYGVDMARRASPRASRSPSSVSTAIWPRLSEGHSSRRTQPFFSSRAMACESRERVIFAFLASSVIRIRRRGAWESWTSSP